MKPDFNVVGIGNAIVDVIAKTDDAFLEKHGLEKGAMRLMTEEEATVLYESMGPGVEISGGSAANTLAGLAALGGKAAFIGTVADDHLGKVFTYDIRSQGVEFTTATVSGRLPTACSYILVTPDAQRTMNTFLGASQALCEVHVDAELIERSEITYLEGYLWDPAEAKKAFQKAMALAHTAGRRVALTLSDSFCVDRYRAEFQDLVENHVQILFANEAEIISLYEADSFEAAVDRATGSCEIIAITRGEKGALILNDGTQHLISPRPTNVVDTTGAGDLFAAGFLYGITQGRSMDDCGKIGAICASEIISHLGARPESDLRAFVARDL